MLGANQTINAQAHVDVRSEIDKMQAMLDAQNN
jgi:hypothetical protein